MPHSSFSTDTDLTAENLRVCPLIWLPGVRSTMRKLFVQIAALKQFDVCALHRKPVNVILRLMREQGRESGIRLVRRNRACVGGGLRNPQTHPDDIVLRQMLSISATLERVSELPNSSAGSVDMTRPMGVLSPVASGMAARVNPGFNHGHSQNTNTSGSENSKHAQVSGTPIPARRTGRDTTSSSAASRYSTCTLVLALIYAHPGTGV